MRLKTRPLTPQEAAILKMIQDGYGPQNTEADVFFTPADEAAVFVKAKDGTLPLMVVLTTLAAMREDGTIASDDELKAQWLRLGST